jgi:hypothetical protein
MQAQSAVLTLVASVTGGGGGGGGGGGAVVGVVVVTVDAAPVVGVAFCTEKASGMEKEARALGDSCDPWAGMK